MKREINLFPRNWRRPRVIHPQLSVLVQTWDKMRDVVARGYRQISSELSRAHNRVHSLVVRLVEEGPQAVREALGSEVHMVGIDFESDAIRFAHIRWHLNAPHIEQLLEIKLPEGAFEDFRIMNRDAVKSALRHGHLELREGGMPANARAIASVDGHSVMVKRIVVPTMTDAELEAQMPREAEQHFPFDLRKLAIGWEVDRYPELEAEGQLSVLLAVVKIDTCLRDLVSVLGEAEFRLVAVEPIQLSLHRSLDGWAARQFNKSLDGSQCIVNVGESATNVVVVDESGLAFSRTINMGYRDCVDRLIKTCQLSAEVAHQIVRTHPPGDFEKVQLEISLFTKELSDVIGKSVDFYLASHRASTIRKIMVAGLGANLLIDSDALVKKNWTENVHLLIPEVNTTHKSHNRTPHYQFSAAIGLALRTEWMSGAYATAPLKIDPYAQAAQHDLIH